MSQASERKKNFSISLLPNEIARLDKRVIDLGIESGFPITRNWLIREVMVAYLDNLEKEEKNNNDLFKGMNK